MLGRRDFRTLTRPLQLAFYDFNLASNTRNDVFSAATFYPFWSGIVPPEVLASAENAFGAFAAVNLVLNRYNGTLPVTFIETGQQWCVVVARVHTYTG